MSDRGKQSAELALWRPLFVSMIHLLNVVEDDVKSAVDLTLLDIGILFATRAEEGRPMGSLAGLFGVDPSVMTYRVRRLQERGLVLRRPSTADGRVIEVLRTPQGVSTLSSARARMLASARVHFFAALDAGDIAALTAAVERLLEFQLAQQKGSPFAGLPQHPRADP